MTLHSKYHDLFANWRTRSIDMLDQGFIKQLEASDAVFMEFADKAENINIQNHFFDAQREIWLKMEDMTQDFHRFLGKQVDEVPCNLNPEKMKVERETLDLLHLDIYEKSLALKTLAEKAANENQRSLYALHQRITVINGGIPIKLKNIPGAPEQICNAFSDCIDRLNLENDALMVLYTLFDKYVLSLLPGIYDALNQQLIQVGILPQLKYHVKIAADLGIPQKAGQSSDSTSSTSEQAQTANELGNETLVRIRDLLATNRAKTNPRKPLPVGVKTATTQEIINTVSTIPKDREMALPAEVAIDQPVDQLKVNRELLTRIQESLANQRHKIKQTVGRDRFSDQQEDVIDVVGLLFAQILDHEALPGITKVLLGHLHTPYIRIGLQDKSFFTNPVHPAREFLNQAIEASTSWIDEEDLEQGIYPPLKNIVHQIIKFRRQKQTDFIEFMDQLSNAIDHLSAKAKLLESRSQESEKGKSQLVRAKEMSQLATEKVFAGEKITKDCQQFIDEVWVDFLTLVLLRNHSNQDTLEWEASQKLARQLLNISQQAANGAADHIGIDQLYTALLAQIGNLLPHQTKAIDRFIRSLYAVQQPTVTIEAESRPAAPPPSEQVDSSLYQELRELPPNTWFQFNIDTDLSTRAKLSWYNEYSDRFLFVDQAGKKVCLKGITELVTEVSQGKSVYFLEPKHSFWDTAMSAIKKLLDKSTTK